MLDLFVKIAGEVPATSPREEIPLGLGKFETAQTRRGPRVLLQIPNLYVSIQRTLDGVREVLAQTNGIVRATIWAKGPDRLHSGIRLLDRVPVHAAVCDYAQRVLDEAQNPKIREDLIEAGHLGTPRVLWQDPETVRDAFETVSVPLDPMIERQEAWISCLPRGTSPDTNTWGVGPGPFFQTLEDGSRQPTGGSISRVGPRTPNPRVMRAFQALLNKALPSEATPKEESAVTDSVTRQLTEQAKRVGATAPEIEVPA